MALRYYISTEEASFFNNNRMGYANSIPTEGNYKVGDFIISSTQENGVFGWVCTVAGNPGEWEVIGSGAADENKVVGYVNAVSFSDTRNSIEIGIDEYKKGKDFLEVHYNGLLLAEGVHYNVSADGKSIVAIDGDWNENTNDTQQMIFRVLRSNVSVIEPTDGSVTIDKLSNDIKEDLAAIDGLVASVDTQNTTISNINDRVGVLESGMSGKQDKTDNSLATTNKTIVGAINELFQSANNGKQLIANAIGEPLDSNDTFSAMSNKINTMKNDLKQVLTDEGVTVTTGDTMSSLISKVDEEFDRKNNEIENSGGGLDIISATELPSEVVNNQIVLISNIDPASVEIKDNSLCNPSVEGIVNVGTTSTNNGKYCTITKDNITVLLYLIRALQYVNGSVKQLSAYVGIDGSWVQFSWAGLYAFISGAYENSDLFGTFTSAPTSSTIYGAYPPEISGNNVMIGQTSSNSSYDESGYYKGNALYYFTTKIDCSNYSKLKITISDYSKNNVGDGYIHFGITRSITDCFSSSTADKYIEITTTGTYEVDLSSYNDTGYIAIYIFSNSYSTTKNCTAYVYISSIELMP